MKRDRTVHYEEHLKNCEYLRCHTERSNRTDESNNGLSLWSNITVADVEDHWKMNLCGLAYKIGIRR